ncbi:Hep/Hag repeat protein, partial [Veillonellaceae bacterium DNF00626]
MNKIYKVIWNRVKNCYVVVSEIAKREGKSGAVQGGTFLRAMIISSLCMGAAFLLPAEPVQADFMGSIQDTDWDKHTWNKWDWADQKDEEFAGTFGTRGAKAGGPDVRIIKRIGLVTGETDASPTPHVLDENYMFRTALGEQFRVFGQGATAIGYQAMSFGVNTTSVGRLAQASGGDATAIGYKTVAVEQSVSLGGQSIAFGRGSVSIGSDDLEAQQAGPDFGDKLPNELIEKIYSPLWDPKNDFHPYENYEIGEGHNGKKRFLIDYSIGTQFGSPYDNRDYNPTFAGGKASVAIGGRAIARNKGGIAIGALSRNFADHGISMGIRSFVNWDANEGMAIGESTHVIKSKGVAVGNRAYTGAEGAIAYGANAKAVGDGSIAIGHEIAANAALESGSLDTVRKVILNNVTGNKFNLPTQAAREDYWRKYRIKFDEGDTTLYSYYGKKYDANGNPITDQNGNVITTWWDEKTIKQTGKTQGSKTKYYNNATAIGSHAFALGDNSLLVGSYSLSEGNNSMALGNWTYAGADNSMAIGTEAISQGEKAMAIGVKSLVSKENAIAFGYNSQAKEVSAMALGTNALATAQKSMSLGVDSKAQGNFSVAMGSNASAMAEKSMSLGVDSKALKENAIAFGFNSQAQQMNAMAMGVNTMATAVQSSAIGNNASATADKSMAIGVGAKANFINSIAIGVGSETDYTEKDLTQDGWAPRNAITFPSSTQVGVISVGKIGSERRISNVASGYRDTDAVNVSQLRSLEERFSNNLTEDSDLNPFSYLAVDKKMGDVTKVIPLQQKEMNYRKYVNYRIKQIELQVKANNKEKIDPVFMDRINKVVGNLENDSANTTGVAASGLKAKEFNDILQKLKVKYPGLNTNDTNEVINKLNEWKKELLKDSLKKALTKEEQGFLEGTNYLNDGAKGKDAIAVGYKAQGVADNSVAIGKESRVEKEAQGGIALGALSSATRAGGQFAYDFDNERIFADDNAARQGIGGILANKSNIGALSIGSANYTRQITNVAGGSADTDAVNVAQLKRVFNMVKDELGFNFEPDWGGRPWVSVGRGKDKNNTLSFGIQGGIQNENETVEGNIGVYGKLKTNTENGKNQYYIAKVQLAKNLKNLESATFTKTVKEGNQNVTTTTIINDKGVTIGTGNNAISLTNGGLAMGGQKITGLANGTQATDAVNLGQLQNVDNKVEGNIGFNIDGNTGAHGPWVSAGTKDSQKGKISLVIRGGDNNSNINVDLEREKDKNGKVVVDGKITAKINMASNLGNLESATFTKDGRTSTLNQDGLTI